MVGPFNPIFVLCDLYRPPDLSVLWWVRDERDIAVYRVANDRGKAAPTGAVMARKLQAER